MWQFNFIIAIMFFSAAFCFILAMIILRRNTAHGSVVYALFLFSASVWIIGQAFMHSAESTALKLFWNRICILGAVYLPLFWLSFILAYTGEVKRRYQIIIGIITILPTITVLFAFIDPLGIPLFWSNFRTVTAYEGKPFSGLRYDRGIWFYIHAFYAISVVIFSLIYLFIHMIKMNDLHKKQILILLAGAAPPFLSAVFYHLRIIPGYNIDLTAIGAIFTEVATLYLIKKRSFLTTMPFARDVVFENLRDLVIVLDSGNRIMDINPAAKYFFESEESIVGKTAESVLPFFSHVLELFDTEKGMFSEIALEAGGEVRYFDLRFSSLDMPHENMNGLIIFLHDISERKAAEDKADMEQRKRTEQERLLIHQTKLAAMGEMLGAIAHQWRQPLNALALLLQDLKDAYQFGEISNEYFDNSVHKAMAQIQFLSKTIDDFRNFFRKDKEKVPFDVKQVIYELLNLISIQFKNYNIVVLVEFRLGGGGGLFYGKRISDNVFETSDTAENEIVAEGYPNEFKQVILNIITNAKDAILESQTRGTLSEKGKIRFIIYNEDPYLAIQIIDNGPGIPTNILHRIFEPYFTTKEEGHGTGIGLYMSKVIIENNMGGKLTAQSRPDGAAFIIKLLKSKTQN